MYYNFKKPNKEYQKIDFPRSISPWEKFVLSNHNPPKKKRRFIAWILLIIYVGLIFYFVPYAVPTLNFFIKKTTIDLNLCMYLLSVVMIIFFYFLLIKKRSFKILKTRGLVLSFILIGYLILFLFFTPTPSERFHIFEYGILGYFVYRALAIDFKDENIYGVGMIILILVGTLDEVLQSFCPNRFGNLKDIFINGLSGLLGLAALTTSSRFLIKK